MKLLREEGKRAVDKLVIKKARLDQTDEINEIVSQMLDSELRETQTANYFSGLYPTDCAVPSANAWSCRKYCTLPVRVFI